MSNFIVLFNEKEGTSNLMMLLEQFQGISVVHQIDGRGWEPFDWHLHRSISLHALMQCLGLVYAPGERSKARLNKIYTRTSDRPLDDYNKSASIGFKMRFALPADRGFFTRLVSRWSPAWLKELKLDQHWYEHRLLSLLQKNRVLVLFAVRQDLFRWALSKYHGDGTGKDGHLQFDIAYGAKRRSEIPPIEVDPGCFEQLLENRRSLIDEKLRLVHKMNGMGIRTATIIYEEYLADPHTFFHKLLKTMDIPVTDQDISRVLDTGTPFRKVHSSDISEFVINHREIEAQFGACVIDFEKEMQRYSERV